MIVVLLAQLAGIIWDLKPGWVFWAVAYMTWLLCDFWASNQYRKAVSQDE